ncbi:HAUS augmin-like complex subunit 8 [Neosynchiropus ocellatus]
MAARRQTTSFTGSKSTSTATKIVKVGSDSGKSTNPAPAKKTAAKSSGTLVKSRYLQAVEKSSLSKSNSLTNESTFVQPRSVLPKPAGVKPKVGTSPRRSTAPRSLGVSTLARETEPSLLGESILQSTFSDGHCLRPDFDVSVIKGKMVAKNPAKPKRNPEEVCRTIEMDTFILAFLTAKVESNTAKLKRENEERLLQKMEEEEALRKEVHDKKRRFLLLEKERTAKELLDIQSAALTPVVECSTEFSKAYESLTTAVDTTLHELPVKNFFIDGDRQQFLDKAVAYLKESEKLLGECTELEYSHSSAAVQCFKDLKTMSKEINQEFSGAFAGLQELSSLLCHHTSLVQQATEEQQLGPARTQELFGLKPSNVDQL